MEIDITKINGAEIINFLNDLLKEKSPSMDYIDIQMEFPLKFDTQIIRDGMYILSFSAHFNNWGTYQLIKDNNIIISEKNRVEFLLEEPFEGDGSEEILEEELTKWLETHVFETDREYIFRNKMEEIYEQLPQISFDDTKSIDEIINKLELIKSYMI